MAKAVSIFFTPEFSAILVDTSKCFAPGGNVMEWFDDRKDEISDVAKKLAPPNHSEARHGTWSRGFLQTQFYDDVRSGRRSVDIVVGNKAPYARFVHEGTAKRGKGFIYTTAGYSAKSTVNEWIKKKQFTASPAEAGYYMPVTRFVFKTKFFLRVRGQVPNPFLAQAYNIVARRTRGGLPTQKFKFHNI